MGGKVVSVVIVAGVLACLAPAHSVIGQSVAVSAVPDDRARTALVTLDVRNEPLERVVRMIAQQAGLVVAFPAERLPAAARVTLQVRGVHASDAFARALTGTGLQARVLNSTVAISVSADAVATPVVQGSISGKIIDGKTRQGLRGATIMISGTNKGTTSNDDGTFRVSDVVPGNYTLHVRMLGYVKTAKPVTVTEGATASVEIVMEPSVNALDQVIVTGTVVATSQREVPNAMTVITAKDIEQRGITKIDQLFRGDVPGLFALNSRSGNALDEVMMFARGATKLGGFSSDPKVTNPIKTYLDGVELADPTYLSQIDPNSIERIEILTGPQASTIYGSNAINGVMQVFTKRGRSSRPQVTLSLLSGLVQNDFRPTLAPQHEYSGQVNGMEGSWSYHAGGSWNYMGAWTPTKRTARLSGFAGARLQRGAITTDGSLRLAITQNWQRGDFQQGTTGYQESGWYVQAWSAGSGAPMIQTLNGQTLGLTLAYAPVSWWSNELVVGSDRSTPETRGTGGSYLRPTDTLLSYSQNTISRRSVRMATTLQAPLSANIRAVVTAGSDAWQNLLTTVQANTPTLTGSFTGTLSIKRQPGHNTGAFVQTQVGFWDRLFMTYGLRAEWNSDFGDDAQPNYAPRYGATYSSEIGPVTAKARVSYGRSTRPPGAGDKGGQTVTDVLGIVNATNSFIPDYGNFLYYLPNPSLTPEHQQGVEGGIEMYWGTRSSLVITRYNQVVDGLIARPVVDSVRSFGPNPRVSSQARDAEGYGYYRQGQPLNIGSIRNQGWELQGSINTGPLTTRGTYSWTKSRVIGVNAAYRSQLSGTQYQSGNSFTYLPEHTWALSVAYARAGTSVGFNLTGTGMLRSFTNQQYMEGLNTSIRLPGNRLRMDQPSTYAYLNTGYLLADLIATHRFTTYAEGIVQIQNIGDRYHSDFGASYATLGRQTRAGVRVRL